MSIDGWLEAAYEDRYYFDGPEDEDEPFDDEEADDCPEHGEQPVTGHSVTAGADPYAVQHLACGHRVVCFGPGEPNRIV